MADDARKQKPSGIATPHMRLGASGERLAAGWLEARGYQMIATAQTYLMEHGIEDRPFRIDVIAVQLTPAGRLVEIRHYPAAVALED
jgi:Holliday junction resolvase-like predicted endonuclease